MDKINQTIENKYCGTIVGLIFYHIKLKISRYRSNFHYKSRQSPTKMKGDIDWHKTSKAKTARNNKISVYPHKASNGFTCSNMQFKYSHSTYWKNDRWLTNKVVRIQNRKKLPDSIAINVLKQCHTIPQDLVRTEVALYGLETILLHRAENLIERTKLEFKATQRMIELLYVPQAKDIVDSFRDFLIELKPELVTNENYDVFKQKEPPPKSLMSKW